MNEIERIKNNNKGEIPDGKCGYIMVDKIPNPEHELNVFKQTLLAFLENRNLDEESPDWEKLLPKQLVEFTNQLEEEDYHKDDLASHIPAMIDDLREYRKWEWYSSEVFEDGFDVVFIGDSTNAVSRVLLHHQGIPYGKIFIEQDEQLYQPKRLRDVLTYKTFDPISLKLTRK